MNWLSLALAALALASWLSTYLLIEEARKAPRIGALTDRAVIGVLLSVMGTAGLVLSIATFDPARFIFAGSFLALVVMPSWWLFRFFTGRLS